MNSVDSNSMDVMKHGECILASFAIMKENALFTCESAGTGGLCQMQEGEITNENSPNCVSCGPWLAFRWLKGERSTVQATYHLLAF